MCALFFTVVHFHSVNCKPHQDFALYIQKSLIRKGKIITRYIVRLTLENVLSIILKKKQFALLSGPQKNLAIETRALFSR